MGKLHHLLFLSLLTPLCSGSLSDWLPFSAAHSSDDPPPSKAALKGVNSEFSIESFGNQKVKKLVEDAMMKQVTLSSCWQEAYRSLFASCSEVIANEEKHSRLAWQLSNCFVKDSGRTNFPSCDMKAPMRDCRKKLGDSEHDIFLQFFIQTNSICHQLQADAFKRETERLINELKQSAQTAEDKLEVIGDRAEELIQNSNQIHDSLASVEVQTQQVAKMSRNVEGHLQDVLKHSDAIYDQTQRITHSQLELQEGQAEMKGKLKSGMEILQRFHEGLSDGMERLEAAATGIEKEIEEVGNSMSSRMQNLQSTANDIGQVAGLSLDKQKQLLSSQAKALEELEYLAKFQSNALEESRANLQELAEFGHRQQMELLQRQEQIQRTHDRLVQNSQSILAAQEEFESKQANIFAALDKLFALYNAILVESRFIKTFFFYSCVIFVLYILTSAKQTFSIRAHLYLGLCVMFVIELFLVRLFTGDLNPQIWIASKVSFARSSFLLAAALYILYSFFSYRDLEMVNHRMLQMLMEKIDTMDQFTGNKLLSLSNESDLSQYSWIDAEFADDVISYEDPNYVFPEEVGENSVATRSIARKYDLRPRSRRQ